MDVVIVALSLSTRLNAIKLKYVSAPRIVPSVVILLCKLRCNKELELDNDKQYTIAKKTDQKLTLHHHILKDFIG